MVLNVHRLLEIAISYTVHSQRIWILSTIISICASTLGGPGTSHALRRPWSPCSSGCEHAIYGACAEIPPCRTQFTVCRCLHLHEDTLSTTVHGVHHDPLAPLPPSRRCVWRVAIALCFTFLYLLLLVLSSPVYFGILTICHKDDILCSFGQGTTSVLPFARKGSVGVAPRCSLGSSFLTLLSSHCRATRW